MYSKMNKKGFTLSEVLIVLVIIGVIAAITVPVMYADIKEHQTVAKVKKFHSTINNALNMEIKDVGTVENWNYETTTIVPYQLAAYFKPHLNVIKDCQGGSGCIYEGNYKLLNGEEWNNYNSMSAYYSMILNDGTIMWFRSDYSVEHCKKSDIGYSNTCGLFWIDVNGIKPPNTIGKDTFAFALLPDRIAPSKTDDCKRTGKGWGCANFIIVNNNMNYPKN